MSLPDRIDSYRVLRLLGEGGMGRVYACMDEALEREVAVKVLLPDVQAMPDIADRFLREARAMAKLSSPNVVTLHAVGSTAEGPYLVMELMEGQDVSVELANGPYEKDVATDIVRQAVLGLSAAADAGLVHRDVKPENLFRAGDVVKVADFGLARPLDGSANITQEGMLIGTPHYMAPELAQGGAPSLQSDVYALGATFFELLTGHPPFTGTGAIEVVAAHVTAPVPLVHAEATHVPPEYSRLIARMMQKEPAARFATYGDLLAALDRVAAGGMVEAAGEPRFDDEPSKKPASFLSTVFEGRRLPAPRRVPPWAIAAAGVGLVVVGAAVFGMSDGGPVDLPDDTTIAASDPPDEEDEVEALMAAAVSERWSARREALKTLKEKDVDISSIEEAVGILDLKQGRSCESRDFGLKRLDRVGETRRALIAVQRAKNKPIDNACMAIDLWAAESKIKRRIREAKKRTR